MTAHDTLIFSWSWPVFTNLNMEYLCVSKLFVQICYMLSK